jgi:nitrate/nitrite transporter NarK
MKGKLWMLSGMYAAAILGFLYSIANGSLESVLVVCSAIYAATFPILYLIYRQEQRDN